MSTPSSPFSATARVHALAVAFLCLTREAQLRKHFVWERIACRQLLREIRQPGYAGSTDEAFDLDWLEDLFLAYRQA